jgi:hypothetical protein
MGSPDATPIPGNREARSLLLVSSLAACAVILVVFPFGLFPGLTVPAAYALPVLLTLCLVLAVGLARAGTAGAPAAATLLGIAFILGGPTFDIVATVIHTPDLKLEANPIARTLLDSGHTLPFVYAYGFVAQGLLVLVQCALWVGLLRHRRILVESLRGFPSLLLFLKAATGGAELTWRQWLFPLRAADLPRAYHLLWLLAVLLLAGVVYRWYLGLEWFGLVPFVRWPVVVLAVVGGLAGYLTWLWYASREDAAACRSGAGASGQGGDAAATNRSQGGPP